MAIVNALDRYKHFSEFNDPLDTAEGVLTPAQRKDRARINLGLAADAGVANSRSLQVSAVGASKLGGSGAGWVVDADNALPLQTLPASQTSEVLLIAITGVPVGATVNSVAVSGQVESAGGNVTLVLDVRKATAAAADFTDASLGTDNVGTLVADTLISSANLAVVGLTEVVAEGEWLYVTLTGTTAAATDIAIAGLMVTYTPAAEA
jgi:hypothetical protein